MRPLKSALKTGKHWSGTSLGWGCCLERHSPRAGANEGRNSSATRKAYKRQTHRVAGGSIPIGKVDALALPDPLDLGEPVGDFEDLVCVVLRTVPDLAIAALISGIVSRQTSPNEPGA
jgi:hypothetical protein